MSIILFSLLFASAYSQPSPTNKCAASAPCANEYGFCGTGVACLAGCDPLSSFSPSSCLPIPGCKDTFVDFSDMSRVLTDPSKWTGDASTYDAVVDIGQTLPSSNGLYLPIYQNSDPSKSPNGVKVVSSRFMLYGTFTVTIETTGMGGIVTSAILMNPVLSSADEIDLEWPGMSQPDQTQTVAWFKGQSIGGGVFPDIAGLKRNTQMNTYSINWQPTFITWSVNGKIVRTLTKSSPQFPQTPMRWSISVWGTTGVNGWTEGPADWSKADSTGAFKAQLKSVSMTCNTATNGNAFVYSGAQDSNGVLQFSLTNAETVITPQTSGSNPGAGTSADAGSNQNPDRYSAVAGVASTTQIDLATVTADAVTVAVDPSPSTSTASIAAVTMTDLSGLSSLVTSASPTRLVTASAASTARATTAGTVIPLPTTSGSYVTIPSLLLFVCSLFIVA